MRIVINANPTITTGYSSFSFSYFVTMVGL